MPNVIIVGAQWGDEGKGKISDILAAQAKHIVRAQGGNNAGHTVMIGEEEFKLHLVPVGILHPHTQCYIGAGTVIDPEVLLKEISHLEKRGVALKGRLWISPAAHVIFPYHRLYDVLLEKKKGALSVGTTGRGIGPCYADKANRLGIRMEELAQPKDFQEHLKAILTLKNEEFVHLFKADPLPFESMYNEYANYGKLLQPMIAHVDEIVNAALDQDEDILFEGAQGTFLDITAGTYPFVTSSQTIAAGICAGTSVGPRRIDHVLGVIKAFTTRVGNGPFPTELQPEEKFPDHTQAREYGTTTGRQRRIGWFDAVLAKTAVKMNSIDSLALTKLDILDTLDEIKICTHYEIDGVKCHSFPMLNSQFKGVPVYETLPGWKQSTATTLNRKDLPNNAENYIRRIEELCGAPISLLSFGPKREQTSICTDIFRTAEKVA